MSPRRVALMAVASLLLLSGCSFSGGCTMLSVWRLGQERMLEVYRHARLDKLAMTGLREDPLGIRPAH